VLDIRNAMLAITRHIVLPAIGEIGMTMSAWSVGHLPSDLKIQAIERDRGTVENFEQNRRSSKQ
jgi:hypothetical protein